MRHDQPQRIAMIRRKRLAIMMSRQQDVVTIEIGKRNVGGKTLLCVDQDMTGLRLGLDQLDDFLEGDALPVIVKAAPAGDAMKVAGVFDAGQLVELVPG